MPVVDLQTERAIVQRGLQRGMSEDQIKQAVLAFRSQAGGAKPVQPQQAAPQQPPKPADVQALEAATKFTQPATDIYQRFAGAMEKTGVPQAVGAVTGAAGGLIGGAVGAAGNVAKDVGAFLTGKPLQPIQDVTSSIARTAADTAGFGYKIGKEATPAAAVGAVGGVLPNLGLAAAQIPSGALNLDVGLREKNPEQALSGALALGGGVMGLKSGVQGLGNMAKTGSMKGAIFNPVAKQAIVEAYPKTKPFLEPFNTAYQGIVKPVLKSTAEAGEQALGMTQVKAKGGFGNQEQTHKGLQKYKQINNYVRRANAKGYDVEKIVQEHGLLRNEMIDKDGTIHSRPAVDALKAALDDDSRGVAPNQAVANVLEQEGTSVPLTKVRDVALANADDSLSGAARLRAHAKIESEIEGLKLDAPDGKNIPLSKLQVAKTQKYATTNYMDPEAAAADKAIARAYKDVIESSTKSADVKSLNAELSKYYETVGYLELLDGKKVEGGRLGRYAARGIGAVAGSHLGPLASIIGAQIGDQVQTMLMQSRLGNPVQSDIEFSPAMKKAQGMGVLPQLKPDAVEVSPTEIKSLVKEVKSYMKSHPGYSISAAIQMVTDKTPEIAALVDFFSKNPVTK